MMEHYFLRLISGAEKGILANGLRALLLALSYIYRLGVTITRWLYNTRVLKRQSLPVPVISIGNLTWGGTGKTPCVDYIAAMCAARNKHTGILLRGYGEDEVSMLKAHNPSAGIISGKQRFRNACQYSETHTADVFILDDGFQHWPLNRALDVVLINCSNPWGNGYLIPRGILREPVGSLRRADLVILTNAQLISENEKKTVKNRIRSFIDEDRIMEAVYVPVCLYRANTPEEFVPVERFKDKDAILLSGIGSPEAFEIFVRHLDINIHEHVIVRDHQKITEKELSKLKELQQRFPNTEIITTEKDFFRDAVYITNVLNPFVLKIEMEIISHHGTLVSRLDRIFSS